MSELRFDGDEVARRRVLWSLPTGLYVLGSTGGTTGPWNLMTINLVTQAAVVPPVLAVSVEAGSRTHGYLEATGAAALSVLHRAQRAVVRRFVKPVDDVEVADGAPVLMAGEPVALAPAGAPYLTSAAACLDLRVIGRVGFESHSLYCCEVLGTAASAALLEGAPSERRVEILRMEDTKMNYGG